MKRIFIFFMVLFAVQNGWAVCHTSSDLNNTYCCAGYYFDDFYGCIACSSGKWSNEGAISDNDCQSCDAGYYCQGMGIEPKKCNISNNYCPVGSTEETGMPNNSDNTFCLAGSECKCENISGSNGKYPFSDTGSNQLYDSVNDCYGNISKNVTCNVSCSTVADDCTHTPTTCTEKVYYNNQPTCNSPCNPIATYTCNAGRYWDGSKCANCGGNQFWCPGVTVEAANAGTAAGRNNVQIGHYSTGGGADGQTRSGESQCEAGNYCTGGEKKECSKLSGVAPNGGEYTSDAGSDSNTDCKYTAPDKSISGCANVTTNQVQYNNGTWPASTYDVTAEPGWIISGSDTTEATCTQCNGANYSAGGDATGCTECPSQTPGWTRQTGTGWDKILQCKQTKSNENISLDCLSGTLTQYAKNDGTWNNPEATNLTAAQNAYIDGNTCRPCPANSSNPAGNSLNTCTCNMGYTPSGTGNTLGCNLTSYTITYDLDGGTNNTTNPDNYNIETSTITLQSPTKNGMIFGGWYDNEDLAGSEVTKITQGSTGNKAFYAKWLCGPGEYYTAPTGEENSKCTACSAGKYQSANNHQETSCSDCNKPVAAVFETGTGMTGKTSADACPWTISCNAGYYWTGTICSKCAAGSYAPSTTTSGTGGNNPSAANCSNCPTLQDGWTMGTTTGLAAVTQCYETKTGKQISDYCAGGTLTKYAEDETNWKLTVEASRLSAAPGSEVSDQTCRQCTGDTYSVGGVGATCQSCGVYVFDTTKGKDEKSDCKIHCDIGTEVADEDADCTTCTGVGEVSAEHDVSYGETSGEYACKTCGNGSYQLGSGCQKCPGGADSPDNATMSSQCYYPASHQFTDTNGNGGGTRTINLLDIFGSDFGADNKCYYNPPNP